MVVSSSGPPILVVGELTCLMCARSLGSVEADSWPLPAGTLFRPSQGNSTPEQIVDWRRLRCQFCGGILEIVELQRRRLEPPLDWHADPPRRGRPPKNAAREDGA